MTEGAPESAEGRVFRERSDRYAAQRCPCTSRPTDPIMNASTPANALPRPSYLAIGLPQRRDRDRHHVANRPPLGTRRSSDYDRSTGATPPNSRAWQSGTQRKVRIYRDGKAQAKTPVRPRNPRFRYSARNFGISVSFFQSERQQMGGGFEWYRRCRRQNRRMEARRMFQRAIDTVTLAVFSIIYSSTVLLLKRRTALSR